MGRKRVARLQVSFLAQEVVVRSHAQSPRGSYYLITERRLARAGLEESAVRSETTRIVQQLLGVSPAV